LYLVILSYFVTYYNLLGCFYYDSTGGSGPGPFVCQERASSCSFYDGVDKQYACVATNSVVSTDG
jgi:hypothetical protein